MPLRCFISLLFSTFCLLVPNVVGTAQTSRPPNVVIILADDLGWADVGANAGSFYLTPHIDTLARSGMRFTDAYAAAPVCSPTRAALLTGKYPARLHITDWLPGRPDRPDQKLARPIIQQALPLRELTLAKALKSAGYISAHIGKWHLGGEGHGPLEHGFDMNIAGNHTGTPLSYFAPYQRGGRFMPGLEDAPDGEYLTDRLTAEAVAFIERNRDKPFFLHLSHYAPHTPMQAKKELIQHHANRAAPGSQTNAIYAAMVESVDDSVGRVLSTLDALGLSKETLVIFTSDNGGLSTREGPNTPATSNAPLRNGKGYLQEGGIRVPLLVKWPGQIEAGRVDKTPVFSADLFPTILAMAGVPVDAEIDGKSLADLLRGTRSMEERTLYWHYPHYANQVRSSGAPMGGGPGAALRRGNWKLIQHFQTGYHELYDLEKDPGEATNLAESMPERVVELGRQLHAWQNATRVQWPKQNPNYANPLVKPHADNSILLHARDAVVHGENLQYEPQPHKDTLGYWTRQDDWAHWDFEVAVPGRYRVEILQGCGRGSGGSEVDFSFGGGTLTWIVEDTGHFQNFVLRPLGEVELAIGQQVLSVKPQKKPGVAVMDLREVRLLKIE